MTVDWKKLITTTTDAVRYGNHPLHQCIRQILADHGIGDMTTLVVNVMPEGRHSTSLLLVTDQKRVYECDLYHKGKACEDTVVMAWRDVTDSYPTRPFHAGVAAAMAMLDSNELSDRAETAMNVG